MGHGHHWPVKDVGGTAPSTNGKTGTLGRDLISHFEGCRLDSYVCPAGVWTIGVGHTGPDVVSDMHITQARADELLAQDLQRFEKGISDQINVPLTQVQFDALVSWAFNCGLGATADSTLRRRLNAGENVNTVISQELPRWTSGGMAGLVRRRDAEVKLATTGQFP